MIREAPVAPGMIRLYRGEGGPALSRKGGPWFSTVNTRASGFAGGRGTMKAIDLPIEEAKALARARLESYGGDIKWTDEQVMIGTGRYRTSRRILLPAHSHLLTQQPMPTGVALPPNCLRITQPMRSAVPPYKRDPATMRGAVGAARYDAISGSMTVPSDAYLGEAGDPVQTLFPAERRRFIQENLDAARKGYQNELKKVSQMDEIALDILPFDRRISEMGLHDWMDGLSIRSMLNCVR